MSSLVGFVIEEVAADSVRPPRCVISLWLLHENCRTICKDNSGFWNHVIGKPEALDIRVSMSSLLRFDTEEFAADSVRPPSFHLAMAPS